MTSAVESKPDPKFPAARRFTGPAWPGDVNDVDDDSVRQSRRTRARFDTYVHKRGNAGGGAYPI